MTGRLVPSAGQKIPAWLVPSIAKDPLAENRFLQAGKGAENTKENPGSALLSGTGPGIITG